MTYALPGAAPPTKTSTVYVSATAITPADNTPIGPFMALYVGVAGNVSICPRNSLTPVVFQNMPAGMVLPLAFMGIQATGTTGSGLVGLG